MQSEQYKARRNTNLELYRIIAMLLIVAHHYVVNSGIMDVISQNPTSIPSLFLLVFGAWGKFGINCFVLITGYFMCTSKITLKKYVKLLLEVYFYRICIYLIFLITGYSAFNVKGLVKTLLPITAVQQNFTGCFLLFYLCIPFLNILIHNMTELQHVRLLLVLGFIYVILGTVPMIDVSMNYVSWFCALYFVASYIRLYEKEIFIKTRVWGWLTILMVVVSTASVVCCSWLWKMTGKQIPFYFVSDSNKILAIATAITSFLFFKNINIKYSKVINTIAASTFGVLLIHANSDTMRQWLWKDVLNNAGMYNSQWLVLHAVLSVFGIFTICTIIDILRIYFVEKFVFKKWDSFYINLLDKYEKIENEFLSHLSVRNDKSQ